MAELVINDLQGGLCTKSPTAALDNQCAYAQNVEWFKSKCGERRLGTDGIDWTGSGLETADRITWVYRHTPTASYTEDQLWALGVWDDNSYLLVYKDSSWHTVTMDDDPHIGFGWEYQFNAVSLHGKLFIAYRSADFTDRLHVWDGTTVRRTGISEPAAPTAAEIGGAGAIDDVRSYRVRFTTFGALPGSAGSGVTRRSEPSEELEFTPTSSDGVNVTMPALLGEGETEWELEAAKSDGIWYRIASSPVGSTVIQDLIADGVSYSTVGTLSEDIGDYSLIPSVKYLVADEDRLVMAGSFEYEDYSSRVYWTPVATDPGAGNDERLALDTDPFKDLNSLEGGPITALAEPTSGYVYAFKLGHVYQGVRTGDVLNAYDFIILTKARGALPGTVVSAPDNGGIPSLFALDPHIGPIRLGGSTGGIETCGSDLIEVWENHRESAVAWAGTTQLAVYVPEKKQIQFWIPGSSQAIVLHTQHMRVTEDGFRGGYSTWNVNQFVYSACNFATNIDNDAARNFNLRPFLAGKIFDGAAVISLSDTGHTDNGVPYSAVIYTRQFVLRNFLGEARVQDVAFYGVALEDAYLDVSITGQHIDTGNIGDSRTTVDFTPHTREAAAFFSNGYAIRYLDELALNEVATLWVGFGDLDSDPDTGDPTTTTTQWAIEAIALTISYPDKPKGR